MTGGQIAAHGFTGDVLNPETIEAVFNVQSKVYTEPYCDALQVIFNK